jgi:ribosomal protein S18 acetylase RimI-like enzyme
MNYPTQFSDQLQELPYDQLGPLAKQAYDQLKERGYEVKYGLTGQAADVIAHLVQEPAIKEYCPKDSSERFTDREATAKWLSKGRAAFLLIKVDDQSVVGYGWAGTGSSAKVPSGKVTFAIRIAKAGQGQGLATPYSRLILAGAATLYNAKDVWLETWQSNAGAVHIYRKIGAQDVDQEASQRPTSSGETVQDTRLYMTMPDELLNV